jgi:hypothetical protein
MISVPGVENEIGTSDVLPLERCNQKHESVAIKGANQKRFEPGKWLGPKSNGCLSAQLDLSLASSYEMWAWTIDHRANILCVLQSVRFSPTVKLRRVAAKMTHEQTTVSFESISI